MKRIKYISTVLLTGLVLLPFAFTPSTSEISVKIRKGMTLSAISEFLNEANVIQDPIGFRILGCITGKSSSLSYGWYRINLFENPKKVMEKLVEGERITVCVTIPEGLDIKQTLNIIERNSDIDVEKMDSLTTCRDFARQMGIDKPTLEGYLFPDTYIFYLSEEPESVLKKMISNLFRVIKPGKTVRIGKRELNIHEILTIASLIEKEAMIDREKPLISSVVHNRLKRNMKLQIDATILYALGHHKSRVYYRDLEVDSPYNTYKYRGLPPGPIANPGYQSILAAIYPADTDYLFYVATGNGDHIFTKTHREHVNEKRRVKKNW